MRFVSPTLSAQMWQSLFVLARLPADEAKLRASSRLPAPSLQLELEAQDSVESEGGVVDDDYDEYDYGDSDSDDALAPAPPSAQPVASGAGAPPRPSGRARRPIASSRLQRQMYKTRSPSVPSWAEKVKMDEDLKDGIPRL